MDVAIPGERGVKVTTFVQHCELNSGNSFPSAGMADSLLIEESNTGQRIPNYQGYYNTTDATISSLEV